MERTQSTAKAGDLVDNFVDDLGRAIGIVGKTLRLTAAKLVQSSVRSTQAAGAYTADTQSCLLVADHVTTELEQSSTAGDIECQSGCGCAWINRQAQIQCRSVDRQLVALTVGLNPVHTSYDIGTNITRAVQTALESARSAFADDVNGNQCIATILAAVESQLVVGVALDCSDACRIA